MRRAFWLGAVMVAAMPLATGWASSGCDCSNTIVRRSGDEGGGGQAPNEQGGGGFAPLTSSMVSTGAGLDAFVEPPCTDEPPPIEDYACDPYDQGNGDCAVGEGCYIFVDYPSSACGQETYGSLCLSEGIGGQGAPCGGPLDCQAGYVCVVADSGTQCVEFCPLEGDSDCPPGLICEPIDVEGFGGCISRSGHGPRADSVLSSHRRGGRRAAAVVGALLAIGATAALVASCGARSELPIPLPDPPPPDCLTFEDCPGHRDLCEPVGCELEEKVRKQDGLHYLVGTCVELDPPDCDDEDECTIDACDPLDGTCSHRPAVLDADGDGYDGPRAGFFAGAPGSCGDDCDDTSAAAHPGATEICDGVDNDCNTIIDDGATWLPLDVEPIRLSNDDVTPAGPGGLAWSGETWMSTFYVNDSGGKAFKSRLAPDGTEIDPHDETLEEANADGFAGPITWIGDRYGTVWTNRGTGDYQIVFALLDEEGTRVTPNLPLNSGGGFSLEPGIAWTGQRFVVVWKQETAGDTTLYRVDGQILDIDGTPLLGAPVTLATSAANSAQAPAVTASSAGIGLAYTLGDAADKRMAVRLFDEDLTPRSDELILSVDGSTNKRFTTIAANRGDYIVAWSDGDEGQGGIWGAVIGDDGAVITQPKKIVDPGPGGHAKWPSIRALGDRALLVYGSDRDADNFESWARMFDARLEPIEEERRITFAEGATAYQITAFGPDGTLGVLFRDDRIGAQHVWFTRLGCAVSQP